MCSPHAQGAAQTEHGVTRLAHSGVHCSHVNLWNGQPIFCMLDDGWGKAHLASESSGLACVAPTN